MARQLPHNGKIPMRHEHHSNAIHTAHPRQISEALAEKPTERFNQWLEGIPQRIHRELQVNLQTTSVARRTESLQTRNPRVFAGIHSTVDNTKKLSRRHLRRKCNRCLQMRITAYRLQRAAWAAHISNTRRAI